VTERKAIEGMQAKTGDVLFQLADISEIWALADISERNLGLIGVGDTATVKPRGYPGRSFAGKISVIYPEIDKATRTAKVRIEVANPGNVLLPGMYADIDIATGHETPVLSVPEHAIIDSGERKIVLLDKGGGRFEPREVKTGRQGGGYVEIRDGIQENDKVVDSANFLIDAESNLKSALKTFAQGDAK
jgi:Cu(I)/Ag(I) efflux system membrane fusion protein